MSSVIADPKEVAILWHQTGQFLINKISHCQNSLTLWKEVDKYCRYLNERVTVESKKEHEDKLDLNIVNTFDSHSSSINSTVSPEYKHSNSSGNSYTVEKSIHLLNQILSINYEESSKLLDSDSFRLNSIPFDSGFDSESSVFISDLIESLYKYLVKSSAEPYDVDSACINKCFSLLNKATSLKGVNEKLIDEITATLKSTLECRDEKVAQADYKVISIICRGHDIISLHTATILVNWIRVYSKELLNDRSYVKLSKIFHLIDTLKVILCNFKSHLTDQTKHTKYKEVKINVKTINKLNKKTLVSSFKRLERILAESVQMIENCWVLSPVLLSLKKCVLNLSDVITLLQSVNR